MMGFWTFQVVTWISAINIRHPWFVSSLIHKMPTPPPEVSCTSGGLLQPQRTRSRQVALFQLPEEINEQKNENSTYIQHTWLEMHLNANLWKSHHANHISCTTHTSLGRCNFRKQAKNKRNTQTHKKKPLARTQLTSSPGYIFRQIHWGSQQICLKVDLQQIRGLWLDLCFES